MDDQAHAALSQQITRVARILGLHDWRIHLSRTPCNHDAYATIQIVEGCRDCTIFVCPGWNTLDASTQLRVLVHELLHIYFHEVAELVIRVSGRFADNSLLAYLPEEVQHQVEHAVDALSSAIVPLIERQPDEQHRARCKAA